MQKSYTAPKNPYFFICKFIFSPIIFWIYLSSAICHLLFGAYRFPSFINFSFLNSFLSTHLLFDFVHLHPFLFSTHFHIINYSSIQKSTQFLFSAPLLFTLFLYKNLKSLAFFFLLHLQYLFSLSAHFLYTMPILSFLPSLPSLFPFCTKTWHSSTVSPTCPFHKSNTFLPFSNYFHMINVTLIQNQIIFFFSSLHPFYFFFPYLFLHKKVLSFPPIKCASSPFPDFVPFFTPIFLPQIKYHTYCRILFFHKKRLPFREALCSKRISL